MNFKKRFLVLSSALIVGSLVSPVTSVLAQIQTESYNENAEDHPREPTDEEYANFISHEIDTLDGEEEKEKEDAYLDEAEKAYNEALKKQEDKRSEDKRSEDKKSEDKKLEDKKSEDKKLEDKKSEGKKQVKRILPKTSAVK